MMYPVSFKKKTGLEGSKGPKKGRRMRFLGFWPKSYPLRYDFLLHCKSANGILTF